MKLQSKYGSMIVDFYPIKTPWGIVSTKWFLKVLTFKGETQSKKYINRMEMNREVNEYIHDLSIPYKVIEFHTIPQLANPSLTELQ